MSGLLTTLLLALILRIQGNPALLCIKYSQAETPQGGALPRPFAQKA